MLSTLAAFADRQPVPVHSRKETEVVRETRATMVWTPGGTKAKFSNIYTLVCTDHRLFNDCNCSIYVSVFLGLFPAYSPSPETSESKPPPSKDPSRWSVEEVVWFIKDADPQALGPHVELFRKHVSVGCSSTQNAKSKSMFDLNLLITKILYE